MPDPPPDQEPDVYELADEPEDTPAPPPPPPTASVKRSTEEPDTIPLDEPEPEIHDPRAGRPPVKPPLPEPDPDDGPADEPKAVSPAKARAAREEQRIRAAQELAEADAKKKKIILTVVGAFVAVGVLGFIALKLF
ncbi:MAG: hypothetical protein AAFX76_07910 [Planctomycetota bacterium]